MICGVINSTMEGVFCQEFVCCLYVSKISHEVDELPLNLLEGCHV